MASELAPIDISATSTPSLTDVVEEVRRTNRPRAIRADGEVVAVLKPAKPTTRRPTRGEPTAEDIAAFEAAAGGWVDVDTERFVRDTYENRRINTRPPVEL